MRIRASHNQVRRPIQLAASASAEFHISHQHLFGSCPCRDASLGDLKVEAEEESQDWTDGSHDPRSLVSLVHYLLQTIEATLTFRSNMIAAVVTLVTLSKVKSRDDFTCKHLIIPQSSLNGF